TEGTDNAVEGQISGENEAHHMEGAFRVGKDNPLLEGLNLSRRAQKAADGRGLSGGQPCGTRFVAESAPLLKCRSSYKMHGRAGEGSAFKYLPAACGRVG